jgi:hypothetical protein
MGDDWVLGLALPLRQKKQVIRHQTRGTICVFFTLIDGSIERRISSESEWHLLNED